ncbi:hypothetical protein [uncultured Clostridium sp.]|uniref:hypothetical protein n=1 Tax=uncultured Clostridium sp. TaxID=59620 RepID=UPI002585138F|nr:hypothetical protein [uncultured Clostridium sp.]
MFKKKYICIFLSIIVLGVVLIGLNKSTLIDKFDRKYLIIQDELILKDKHYIKLVENLSATELGKQIGVTDQGHQVFEIKGQDSNDWICVRDDNVEFIYRNRDIPFLTIERFKTDKIIVKNETISGGERKTIIEQNAIDKILADLTDKNLSNQPESIDMSKKVNLYSEAFPGLCFTLYYFHDNKSNTCFLYDYSTEDIWVIGGELLKQLL